MVDTLQSVAFHDQSVTLNPGTRSNSRRLRVTNAAPCLCGDQAVKWSDGHSRSFKMGAEVACFGGVMCIEMDHSEAPAEKGIE